MKRLFAIALMLSLLLVGCQNGESPNTFDTLPPEETAAYTVDEYGRFVYKLYKEAENYAFTLEWIGGEGKFERGKEITVQLTIKSLMDEYHTVYSLDPDIELICTENNYVIRQDPNRPVDDMYSATIVPYKDILGGGYLVIPSDAVAGTYDLKCAFDGSAVIFENIFTLD